MITLYKYLHESLLDDLDDLETTSDDSVRKANTIGQDYYVKWITLDGLQDNLDKKKILKLPRAYNSKLYHCYKRMADGRERGIKPSAHMAALGDVLLSMNKGILDNEEEYVNEFLEIIKSVTIPSRDTNYTLYARRSKVKGYIYIYLEDEDDKIVFVLYGNK